MPTSVERNTILDHKKVKGSTVDLGKLRDTIASKYADREFGEFLFDDAKKLDDNNAKSGSKFGVVPAAVKTAQKVREGYLNFDRAWQSDASKLKPNEGGGYESAETFAFREQHHPMVAVVVHYKNPDFGPVATLIDGTNGVELQRARIKPAKDGTWQVHWHTAGTPYGD